jgi:hypothetical protein
MLKFSTKIEGFLKNHVGDQNLQDQKLTLIPNSTGKFRPGNLLIFRYIIPYSSLKERSDLNPDITKHPHTKAQRKAYEARETRIQVKHNAVHPHQDNQMRRGGSANSRLVLVVRNKRTGGPWGGATFTSTKGNELLSCFRLETISPEITSVIVDKLYKNVRLCSYSRIVGSLSTILGSKNYRTYKVSKLSQIYEVNV